ncbi:MAG TPA: SDR family NAD(P)-dependent oxidoreductase [Sedimentisphaerales bacterium]|nr:SDR family NAD(P)-dependent oxidoreductase [Sedimentisphaerales bacterium]
MHSRMEKETSQIKLARLTPIVRGLLAERTGKPDTPYAPIILKSLTTKKAIAFSTSAENTDSADYPAPLTKGDGPPLFINNINADDTPQIRKQLSDAISAHSSRYGVKPTIICLSGLGVLHVEQKDNTDLPLANKVALITGAAGAIGYGICRGLLENGCRVAVSDLPGEKLDNFAADLNQTWPDRTVGAAIDVTDAESVVAGLDRIIQTWGGIDIVAVNAGIAMVCRLKEMDLEAFRKLERVNVEGTLLTLREIARHFVLQATGGDIVIVSTKNVPSPGAGFGAYSATKAACHQLGRIASLELAEFGVRVNMVAPDGVFSEGKYKSGLWAEVGPDRMRARGLDEKGLAEYYRNRNLLKIQITGRHVANAVLFFATRQAPTTGITLPVDGGLPDATPR